MTSSPSVSNAAHAHLPPPPPSSRGVMRGVTDAELGEAWFDAAPASARRPSSPPPPAAVVGEFLGDELADSWLR